MTRRPLRERLHRRHADARSGEHGAAAVELVIVFPVVLLLLFAGMQGALLYQGRATALAAAQEGARVAAGEQGTRAKGYDAAYSFARASALDGATWEIDGDRGPADATFTVTVTTQSVVPLWDPVVTQSATMPVERITG